MESTYSGYQDTSLTIKLTDYDQIGIVRDLITGYTPEIGKFVLSPFRPDNRPGCYFTWSRNTPGMLVFMDHGDTVKSRNLVYMLMAYKKVSFATAVAIIEKYGKSVKKQEVFSTEGVEEDIQTYPIYVEKDIWRLKDQRYWSSYHISRALLEKRNVYPITKFTTFSRKKGDLVTVYRYGDIMYFFDFGGDRGKVYSPNNVSKRFATNLHSDDIGSCIVNIEDKMLIITKSLKDSLVLESIGINNVWFQNEGCLPSQEKLKGLLEGFEDIIIWYDNDSAGVLASNKLFLYLRKITQKNIRQYFLPDRLIKDPSDYAKEYGILKLKDLWQDYHTQSMNPGIPY